jgi:hypothetical protein
VGVHRVPHTAGEWLRLVLAVVAIALAIVHGVAPGIFRVDTTTLGLLAFLLVLLVLPQIEELDLFGSKIRLRERVQETKELADRVDEETRAVAPDAEEREPVAPVVAGDRARVIAAIATLYGLVYDEDAPSVEYAIARLRDDGFLRGGLSSLATSLLALTSGQALSPAQAEIVAESAAKFFASLGRVASLTFEDWVHEALVADRSLTVERRPAGVTAGKRSPDLLVTKGDRRLVVEAYLPRDLANVERRIRERLPLVEAARAVALLVVLPNGIHGRAEFATPDGVIVMLLRDVEDAARRGLFESLSRPPAGC